MTRYLQIPLHTYLCNPLINGYVKFELLPWFSWVGAVSDTLWSPGEPNNANSEDENVAHLLFRDGHWGLNDISMSQNLRYICERPGKFFYMTVLQIQIKTVFHLQEWTESKQGLYISLLQITSTNVCKIKIIITHKVYICV